MELTPVCHDASAGLRARVPADGKLNDWCGVPPKERVLTRPGTADGWEVGQAAGKRRNRGVAVPRGVSERCGRKSC